MLAFKAALFLAVAIFCAGNAYNIDFKDTSQDDYRFGNRYLAVGNYERALLSYRAAVKKNPGLDHANLNMGVAFLKMGELDSARTYLHKQIESGFASAKAYNNMSVVERLANNDSLSYRYAEQAVELNPGYVEALVNMTVVARRIGKHIEAIERLGRAIELQQDSPKITYHRGILRFDLGQYQLAEADFLASLDNLRIPVQPTFATAPNPSSESLRERELDEDEALIHYHLGTIAGQKGLLDSARIELRKAVLLNPELSEARTNLISALNQLGRYNEAEQEAQALLDSGEASHILWYLLALTRLNLGKIDAAESAVDSALSLMPDFQPARILKTHFNHNKQGGD
jgi:tetratricopeptide (TPR) repeat protein